MWKSIATIIVFFKKVMEICKQKVKEVTFPKKVKSDMKYMKIIHFFFEVSQASQGTESSQEETEH